MTYEEFAASAAMLLDGLEPGETLQIARGEDVVGSLTANSAVVAPDGDRATVLADLIARRNARPKIDWRELYDARHEGHRY